MTFEEALALIPTHIILRPEKDRWQSGDEVVVIGMSVVGLLSKVHSQEWEPYDERDSGRILLENQIGRRPIPESVRKSMAWWNTLEDICQTHISYGVLKSILEDFEWYVDKIEEYKKKYPDLDPVEKAKPHLSNIWDNFTKEEINDLGGPEEILKNLCAGRNSLHRWLLSTQGERK